MNLLQIHEPGQTPLPHSDTLAVGIDLGTTHSVVAVAMSTLSRWEMGGASPGEGDLVQSQHNHISPHPEGEGIKAEVIRNIHGHALVPSVVYYAPDGSVDVGYSAKKRGDEGQKNVIASVKRRMHDAAEKIVPLQNATATYEQTGAAGVNPYGKWAVAGAIDKDEKGKTWGWACLLYTSPRPRD